MALEESYFIKFQVASRPIALKSTKKTQKPTQENCTLVFLPSHNSGDKP